MFNKLGLGILVISLFYSCAGKGSKNSGSSDEAITCQQGHSTFTPYIYLTDNGDLNISNYDGETKIEYSYLDLPYCKYNGNLPINIRDLLRKDSAPHVYEIALHLCEKDSIPIAIRVNDNYRDTVYYKYKQQKLSHINGRLESGVACRLVKRSETIQRSDVIRWLYNNNLPLGEGKIDALMEIIRDLSADDYLYPEENVNGIPVIKSFSNQRYRVSSNMKADYYYLFAAKDIHEIDNFVADMVSDGFPEATSNLSSTISCFRKKDQNMTDLNLLVICLVGINRDWAKQFLPLGLVCIDSYGPSYIPTGKGLRIEELLEGIKYGSSTSSVKEDVGLKSFDIQYNGKRPSNETFGVSTGEFYGNLANFTIYFTVGVESITFKYKEVSRTIKLSGKDSPYTTDVYLPLNLGVNKVIITARDKFGNDSYPHEETINMVRIKDDGINIDNSITIYN